ncbi:AAA family ATPase [Streptomyces sp. NPDC088923]|uniref:AAA family ATPase n=1 Tax=Streptomyces sp. NPDC088923 TaxID=3365913 RepID=UPI0037F35D04
MSDAYSADSLVVLVGPPGSGKSTAARCWPSAARVSLDAYRALCTGSEADQTANVEARVIQRLIISTRLERGLPVVVDSTNTSEDTRASLLRLARHHGREAHAVLLDTPLAACLARNAARARRVPEAVIRAKHAEMPSRAALLAEGFATATLWSAR